MTAGGTASLAALYRNHANHCVNASSLSEPYSIRIRMFVY